jgi:hypothetical protein
MKTLKVLALVGLAWGIVSCSNWPTEEYKITLDSALENDVKLSTTSAKEGEVVQVTLKEGSNLDLLSEEKIIANSEYEPSVDLFKWSRNASKSGAKSIYFVQPPSPVTVKGA